MALSADNHSEDRLMAEVMHRAAVLAALPLTSLVQTKALMTRTRNPELKAAIKLENAALDQLAGGPANREALAAFAAKREPDFTAL
jgi:enoyl-CoA hydratase/carnithine racemase